MHRLDFKPACQDLLDKPPKIRYAEPKKGAVHGSVSEEARSRARRVAKVLSGFLFEICWRADSKRSQRREDCRNLLYSGMDIMLSKQIEPYIVSNKGVALDPPLMRLIGGVFEGVSTLLVQYHKDPSQLRERETAQLRKPTRQLSESLVMRMMPKNEALRDVFNDLSRRLQDWMVERVVNPHVLTEILCSLKIDLSGGPGDVGDKLRPFKEGFPGLCQKLGQSALDCLQVLHEPARQQEMQKVEQEWQKTKEEGNAGQKFIGLFKQGVHKVRVGAKTAVENKGIEILRDYEADLGAFILLAAKEALEGESAVLPVLENLINAQAGANKTVSQDTFTQEYTRLKPLLEAFNAQQHTLNLERQMLEATEKELDNARFVPEEGSENLDQLLAQGAWSLEQKTKRKRLEEDKQKLAERQEVLAHKRALVDKQNQELEAKQRARLQNLIETDFSDAISGLVAAVPVLKKALQNHTADLIQAVAPVLVDMLWDDSRLVESIVFNVVPQALNHYFFPDGQAQPQKPKESTPQAKAYGLFFERLAADYLYPCPASHTPCDVYSDDAFRSIFLKFLGATGERLMDGMTPKSGGQVDPNLEAQRQAEVAVMLHLFLEHWHRNELNLKKEPKQELLEFVAELVRHWAPDDEGFQERCVALAAQGLDAFHKHFLTKEMLVNIFTNYRLPDPSDKDGSDADQVEQLLEQSRALLGSESTQELDAKVKEATGHQFTRAARSAARSMDDWGWTSPLTTVAIWALNKYNASFGELVLCQSGPSKGVVEALNHIFWFTGEDRHNECRFSDENWTQGEEALDQKSIEWFKRQPLRVMKQHIQSATSTSWTVLKPFSWGLSWLAKGKASSATTNMAELVNKLLADELAMQALLYHYLLPLWKQQIADNICGQREHKGEAVN